MDDFCIPGTPLADPFDPYEGAATVDITNLGRSTASASRRAMRPRELDVDTVSTSHGLQLNASLPGDHMANRRPLAVSTNTPTRASPKDSSRVTYFSALTQRCSHQGQNTPIRPASAKAPIFSHPQSQPSQPAQLNTSQPGTGDAGYRGIQDAIATKFQDLESQIKTQEHEITELRFALTDAHVATDTLETEKRKLKKKNEDLERKLKESSDKIIKVQESAQRDHDDLEKALNDAVETQHRLQNDALQNLDKAKHSEKAFADAQDTIKGLQGQIGKALKEQRDLMHAAAGKHRRDMEDVNKKIGELSSQLQRREAELQSAREAGTQLAKKIEDIPERNFQALSTCVAKILERLDDHKSEILTSEKTNRHQFQDQHKTMVQYLEGLLASSQTHLEMLGTYRDESKQAVEQVLGTIRTSDSERKGAEASCRDQLESMASNLQARLEDQQACLIDALDKKCRESDLLASVCDKQATTSRDVAKKLDEQLSMSREQTLQLENALCSLQRLQEAPKEDARMVAKIQFLQQQNAHLASEIKDRDAQVATLEAAYKERTASSLEGAAKFASDIQQLSDSFRQREEEYRRALDHAADLASKEAKRSLDEAREVAQHELQQERTKRQALEKDVRQAREDLSVLEESNKRYQHAQDALQRELTATKLGCQAVTEHLEERTRTLEDQVGRDAAALTRLKAALADKEIDYANLRSSIEAYEGKVHVLVEHLRGWAQDYTHIGVIRARLEMLEQIDRSCAVTARIREAEQINSVLALLRQYNARQYDHTGPDHDVVAPLKTPANAPRKHSSSIQPPPVHNDRTVVLTLGPDGGRGPMSPDVGSSPVPRRPRRGTRPAASRDSGSPLHARPNRRQPSTLAGRRGDANAPDDAKPQKRRHTETEYSAYFDRHESDGGADDISTSPPSFIKMEGL